MTDKPADLGAPGGQPRRRSQITAFAREAFAVLAAILMAFGLDAAWDGRVERRETREALDALLNEFEEVRNQLAFAIEYNVRQINSKDSFLELDPSDLAAVPDSQALVMLERLRWAWTFDPSRGALDGVVARGRVEQIENPNLQRLVAGWPGIYSDLQENTIVQWGDALQRRRVELGLEARLRALTWAPEPTGARELLVVAAEDPILRDLLAAYSERIEQYLRELEPALERLEETIRLLEVELT